MKTIIGLVALLALVGCGNPHLERKKLENAINPIIEAPLKASNVDGRDNLSIITGQPAESAIIEIERPRDTVIVEYKLEKGDHFRFKGGRPPGDAGNCQLENITQTNCLLDIEFFADAVGVYRDNLLITYAPSSNPENKRTLTFPLYGERQGDALRPLVVTTSTSDSGLNVRTPEDSINSPLSIRNPNDEETVVEYAFESGSHFRFKGGSFPGSGGSCANPQAANSSCEVDIEFFATEPGIYQDNLILTSYLSSHPENRRVLRIPLRGERIARPNPSLTVTAVGGGSSLDLGTATVGSPVRQDRITVSNNGNVNQQVDIRLETGAPFSFTENCPEILPASQSCEIIVSYSSNSEGTHRDFIIITHTPSDGGAANVQRVPVIGVTTARVMQPGLLTVVGINAQDLDFGRVRMGDESLRIVEIRNIGELPVNLSDINFEGANFSFTGDYPGARGTCGRLILPGSCTIEIRFRPSAAESQTGKLNLVDANNQRLVVNLRGQGRENPTPRVCHAEEEVIVVARPNSDRNGVVFPYNASARGTAARLSVLYGMATNSYVRALNRYTVKDAQVFVSYQIPRLNGEIIDMELQVDIAKVIQDGHKDTESLCLTSANVKKCSGREFSLASWRALRNPTFWASIAAPVTSTYEDEFSAVETRCGASTCFSLQRTFDAKQIFALSAAELASLENTGLSFIFSDDTRLRSMPVLKLKVKKQVSCR